MENDILKSVAWSPILMWNSSVIFDYIYAEMRGRRSLNQKVSTFLINLLQLVIISRVIGCKFRWSVEIGHLRTLKFGT